MSQALNISASGGGAQAASLRREIVRVANEELARWGNGAIKETDRRILGVLRDYWATGTGINYSVAQLGSATFQSEHPWSAAFISWVMQKAGAGQLFRRAAAHSVYIYWAKQNRVQNRPSLFKAYRVTEVVPQAGDLVCKHRANSGATYDTIRPGMKTHCDIVTEVRPGQLVTVGGNVRNSVSPTIVRTDARGLIQNPAYFAIILLGNGTPAGPRVPPPAGPASTGTAPRLLRQETQPPGTTLYVNIDLGIVAANGITALPVTGIFIPSGYRPGTATDVILYLHGFKPTSQPQMSIATYWNRRQFPHWPLREGVNDSQRNVILVAPTLGSRSQAGRLVKPGGLDVFLGQVLAAVQAYGPRSQGGQPARLGSLILACHSGGGLPMRMLAGGSDQTASHIREAWGFDCTYNHTRGAFPGDDAFWAGWARAHPDARVYIYYRPGSGTAPLALSLRRQAVANVNVEASQKEHNDVPITYWRARIQGAPFLAPRSAAAPTAPAMPITPTPSPSDAVDVGRMTHAQFIEFVGRNARPGMAETGVPASVTVAQAIIETGWGRHTIGSAKNLFGIKGRGPAGSVQASTREFVNGRWITVKATFAAYNSFEESITEHARFFRRNQRYAEALRHTNNPDRFAREIQRAGYATAPTYADVLISLMQRHNLYRFDK